MDSGNSRSTPRNLDSLKRSANRRPARRLRDLHDRLADAYGPQFWWPAQTPFEVILGAYLTQNTAWKAVERSLENLRLAGAVTIEGLRNVSTQKLQELIRPSGFAARKAAALKAFVSMLDAEFAGSLDTMSAQPTQTVRARLLQLFGVGPETADAILAVCAGPSGADGGRVPAADRGAAWAARSGSGAKQAELRGTCSANDAGVCGRCG